MRCCLFSSLGDAVSTLHRYDNTSPEQLLRELAVVNNLAANNLSFEHIDSIACQSLFLTFDSRFIPRSAEYFATVGLDDPYKRVMAQCRALFEHSEFGAVKYVRVARVRLSYAQFCSGSQGLTHG